VCSDTTSKIERFLVQPAVEKCMVGRHRASVDKAPLLLSRAVFASAGFTPVQASTFAESQAESMLHKVPVRGFRLTLPLLAVRRARAGLGIA
jgi:hypothetical protein